MKILISNFEPDSKQVEFTRLGNHLSKQLADGDVSITLARFSNIKNGREVVEEKAIKAFQVRNLNQSRFRSSVNRMLYSFHLLFHAITVFRAYDIAIFGSEIIGWHGLVLKLLRFVRGTRSVLYFNPIDRDWAGLDDNSNAKPLSRYRRLAFDAVTKVANDVSAVVVPSEDMLDTLRDNSVVNENVVVIPPFAFLPERNDLIRKTPARRDGILRVVSAIDDENSPLLEMVSDAAFLMRNQLDVEFIFAIRSDNRLKDEFKQLCGPTVGNTVTVVETANCDTAHSLFSTADIGLVVTPPSELLVAFSDLFPSLAMNGCSIVAVADLDSDLTELFEEENIGAITEQRSGRAVADAIRQLIDSPAMMNRNGIMDAANKLYNQQSLLDRWHGLVHSVVRKK